MTAAMRAITFNSFGAIDVLRVESVVMPELTSNQVLIQTKNIGLGGVDVLIRKGKLEALLGTPPVPLGLEATGVVAAVGGNIKDFSIGQEVVTIMPPNGAYAEFIVGDAALTVALPQDIPAYDAAGMVNLTAAYLAIQHGGISNDTRTVMVHGASGGLGSAMGQMLRALYPDVHSLGTVRDISKKKFAMSQGFKEVISSNDFTDESYMSTSERPKVIFDPIGGELRRCSLRHLQPQGSLIALGNTTAEVDSMIPSQNIWLNGQRILGFNLGLYAMSNTQNVRQAMAAVLRLASDGSLSIKPTRVFAFDHVAEAHEYLESGHNIGCSVLQV